ncbi:cation-transporting P-type ATPase [Guyparkeria sp. 1SP6A2]|nr:cation-transporting P-type ATPase [Guyparkeria sp. 1SP6A2]
MTDKGTSSQWHAEAPDVVLARLDAHATGLSREQIEDRQAKYGPNRLPEAERPSPWRRLLRQFHNILIYVLLASAMVTALLAHWLDTVVILAVVIANAVIGFIQEGKAEEAMDSLRRLLALKAAVIRDNQRQTVPGEELVPGDVVLLESGDRVPADLRLLEVHDLHVQEAILTGESEAVKKQVNPVDAEVSLGDRRSMAFSGTLVTRGNAKGVVIGIGESTEVGRISDMLEQVEQLTTPLLQQMERFGRWLTGVILLVAGLILVLGTWWRQMPFGELFIAVVGFSVAAIPEGLPAVLTITLAVGVQAMARRQAIVRRLPAIEAIGSVSVICTDKTGTLTRNEMAVTSVVVARQAYELQGRGYSPVGQAFQGGMPLNPGDHDLPPALVEAARIGLLCNDSHLREKQGDWQVEGDPMEGALLAFAGRVGLDREEERAHWSRSDAIPFDAGHRFMATLDHDHEEHARIFVKGAPEQLLGMCDRERGDDDQTRALDAGYWEKQAEQMSSHGQRVLALAERPVETSHVVLEHHDVGEGLIFLGLVGLSDPPRREAIDAVAECRRAGIRVKMITGDHAGTAKAVAVQVGLENPSEVITGRELDELSDDELEHAVLRTDVFARSSPQHKLRLVKALQSQGHSVAMTGDGVNDTPALKRADVGIAMGQKGSEAAKEVSDLVLADDNFASIVAAVREGRTVYANIKKVISWTLPTNAGEALTIIVALLAAMTLPVTPIQILWINLVTATSLGLALAFEPTEETAMQRPPRSRGESLLSHGWLVYIAVVGLLFVVAVFGVYWFAIERGYSVDLARTMAMNTLVVLEIFQLFFIRNIQGDSLDWSAFKATRPVWLAVGGVVIAQLAMTYLPFMQAVFATEPLSLSDGGLILAIGLLSYFVLEGYKMIWNCLAAREISSGEG